MDIERLAGTRLGSYEVEGLLGRGGMGVVYMARQVSLDRLVALKILPPNLSRDPSYISRFKREARAVAKLSHTNIVQIFDISEENELHFFSMEFIDGRTLDSFLEERGSLEPDEAVRIISQAARGIEHAHRSGIIHRDIKPSNIILDEPGNVKVMDFGLARIADDHSKLTQSGALMGTLDYMSPEQCRGDELDERTDIYSLGVVLYEMLSGRVPFEAPNEAALINKIINEKSAEVSSVNPNVPSGLNDVVSRAISKTRETRYHSIGEFLEDVSKLSALGHSTSMSQEKASPSIAVLPFVNMSADPEQEYFCDGLAEELINALTQIKDLHVVARTSAFSFKGEKLDVRDIGKKLNVATVLEGSVRKAGNRLRITGQLVNVADGYHLWSERFDREMDDVFAIQDEITLAIVEKLKPKLLKEEKAKVAKRQTVDLEAYNLYLKGRWFSGKMNVEDIEKAIDYFWQAIRKDPNFALAYAELALAYIGLAWWGSPPREAYSKGKEAALKALEINDTVAEAHSALALAKLYLDLDWQESEKENQLAIEKNPGSAGAHFSYAWFLSMVGKHDEAITEVQQALELDPLNLLVNINVGTVFTSARQYDKAIEAFQRTIELDPMYSHAHDYLAFIYVQKSMPDEAMIEFEKQRKISRGWDPLGEGLTGLAYAVTGETEKAREILDELIEQSGHRYVSQTMIAAMHLYLNETDKGFEWLEKAYEARDPWLFGLKVNPVFDIIRDDPRYHAMLKKIGLDK